MATCNNKFSHAVFELRERKDRKTKKQTNRHTHHSTSHPSRGEVKVSIEMYWA